MVWRRCKALWITGMHKPVYDGVSAQEIEAAARLHRIAEAAYPDLLACIATLEQATREARNEPD